MQTPIEFAKNFLIQVYTKQDTTAALACLAPDMIWVTPEKSCHLKEQKEVYDFLKEEIVSAGEKYYVDVSDMMSDPCAETIRVVTFDVALVPVDPKKTLYMRTSFVIRTEKDGYEITFFHMSRKFSLSDPGPFREFIEYLPGPVMIVRGHGAKDLRLAFQNSWFFNHLGYTEKEFDLLSKKDPFFMFLPADKDQIKKIFSEPVRQALTIRVTAKTKNGGDYRFEVLGKYAFDEEDAKISYLEFHSIDMILAQERQDKATAAAEHQKELDELNQEKAALQAKIDAADADKEAALNKEKEEAAAQLDQVREEAAARVISAKKVTEKILAASKEEQERKAAEAEADKEKALADQKAEYEGMLSDCKASCEQKITDIKGHYKAKFDIQVEKDTKEITSLSKEVKELTRQLEDADAEEKNLKEQVAASEEAAAKAEAGRREFLVRMQSDLRKPSEASLGLLSQIEAGGLDDSQKDAIEKIREASTAMLDMVDSLLNAAKLDNNQRKIRTEEFVFADLIREIRRNISKRCKEKDIGLRMEVQEGIPEVMIGDREALKRVLMNILDNSLKYTGQGGQISFDVKMRQMEDDLCPLIFSVIDTGVGIEDALMPVLFEPFTRGSNESVDTEEYPGFGLGLSTANSLIKMMGGSIGVTSTPGVGSYFTVQVGLKASIDENGRIKETRDLEKERTDTGTKEHTLPELMSAAKGEYGGRRVLVVEDDPLNIEIVRELLTRKGIATVKAQGGAEAIRLFRAHPIGSYDAILVDYRMPIMDGLETARKIRAIEEERKKSAAENYDGRPHPGRGPGAGAFPPVPIIALTQSAFEEDMAGSFSGTIDSSLSKPVEAKKLYELLGKAFRKV